ncbi:hypothetical protein GWK47_015000 [Chionoecetes opilio]|uniref:Nuclease HARBI1 n=1 Tax=Chionoecetes opilio TaxID=41210 RepID=A0A8J5C021_CHIOP|nr:hypothetical protein GWK47_015000 [Chionoecetes opilio]
MADYPDYPNYPDYPDYWDQVDLENEIDAQDIVGRGRRRRRVVTDRMNPFTAMSDAEFVDRFRLKKASMSDLIEEIRDQLPAANDLRDRMNPFTAMSDAEFVDRFRLKKASMSDLIEEIRDQLPAANDLRGCPVPPYLQTLIAIRCMATGDHQRTLGDCHDVSQTTVSQCLKIVSRAIANGAGLNINYHDHDNVVPVQGVKVHLCELDRVARRSARRVIVIEGYTAVNGEEIVVLHDRQRCCVAVNIEERLFLRDIQKWCDHIGHGDHKSVEHTAGLENDVVV